MPQTVILFGKTPFHPLYLVHFLIETNKNNVVQEILQIKTLKAFLQGKYIFVLCA